MMLAALTPALTRCSRRAGRAFAQTSLGLRLPAFQMRQLRLACQHLPVRGWQHISLFTQKGLRGSRAPRGNTGTFGSPTPRSRRIMAGFFTCCSITAGSFACAAIANYELAMRRVPPEKVSSYIILGCLGVFSAVHLLGTRRKSLKTMQFLNRHFLFSMSAFRPTQLLGATVRHTGLMHLACNALALISIFDWQHMLQYNGHNGSLFYSAALMLSASAWAMFLHRAALVTVSSNLPSIVSCGASAGLLAVLASQFDSVAKYRIPFTAVRLSCRDTVVLLAFIDASMLILQGLKVFRSPIAHVSHLLGMCLGVLSRQPVVMTVIDSHVNNSLLAWKAVKNQVARK